MRTGPRVWPRRKIVLLSEIKAPRFSSGATSLRSEKALGRLRVCATPKSTAGTKSSHTEGTSDTRQREDRKSTRLNSSHANISYAVFCLKKKKTRALRKTNNR